MSNEKFYLRDEKHFNVPTNKEVVVKDQLQFTSTIKSLGGPKMEPNIFDDKATKQHVKDHPDAFNAFMAENPGFILPWDREVGGPSFKVVEEVPVKVEE